MALGDVDADGDLDLFVATYEDSYLLLNDGTGINWARHQTLVPSAYGRFADIDGDGDLDLLGMNGHPHLNDGAGNFSESSQATVGALGVGDFDGDGDVDVYTGSDEIKLNDGTGSFTLTQSLTVAGFTMGVAIGDVDADGDIDAFLAEGYGYYASC